MIKHDRFLILLGAAMLSGCASSGFVSSWKAPDATPLEFRGAKVAAVVMMKRRRAAARGGGHAGEGDHGPRRTGCPDVHAVAEHQPFR